MAATIVLSLIVVNDNDAVSHGLEISFRLAIESPFQKVALTSRNLVYTVVFMPALNNLPLRHKPITACRSVRSSVELLTKMRKHPEINWNQIAVNAWEEALNLIKKEKP